MKALKAFLQFVLFICMAAVVAGIVIATVYAMVPILVITGISGLLWLGFGYARYEKTRKGKGPE